MQDFWSPVFLSVKVFIVAVIFTAFFGIYAGKWLSGKLFRGKIVLETILMIPLVLPPTVVGLILILFFGNTSFIGKTLNFFQYSIMFTWWAAVISSIVVAFPLMFQTAKQSFLSVDRDITNAAYVDGAGEWKVFWKIEVPLTLKQLAAGIILSFTRSFGEFGATLMFAGNLPGKTQTVPVAIYMAYETSDMQKLWLWVAVSIAISFLFLWMSSCLK
ncbi:molybdate transport system permease protein [Neobacillus niacini]|uniref:molybdate ABC transporter permease subunit n=1 Tax=Neobacillus niacini TaxID=86668 RepID=UPI0027826D6B|nr:molybdate ABC transporter permease subunit [Neobacillus niacini]MDQ1005157.1 molybdate transport system permease protein [Neobacillus niacini]